MNLFEQIQQGESKTLELKSQLPLHEQIAKTVVAFANTSGGKLVIGVSDNREIIGIDEETIFSVKDQINSIIFDRCYPAILPEIYSVNQQGKLLLVVEVFRGNLLPYYLKAEGKNKGTYLRIGASNRKADFDHILELERQKRNQSFDEELCREEDLSTLDLSPLNARFSALGKPLNDEKLKNLKLIQMENSTLYPTQGLLILLGKYPHVVTKCARFKGTDMTLFLDRKEYSGDLFSQLEQVEAFIKNHINLRGEIKGLQRTDTFEIPETALREALINAVIHRDYSNQGRDIKVGVYDDIVNIVSPGGFPNSLTVESLTEGRSEIRNRVVARVFKELGFIEQWGSGIQRIKNLCTAHGLVEPRIREQGDFVDVEFYRPVADTAEKVSDTEAKPADTETKPVDTETKPADTETKPADTEAKPADTFTRQVQIIMQHLNAHPTIGVKVVGELLEIKDSRAREVLQKMTDKGLLEKCGSARSTHYVSAIEMLQRVKI
jgi:ATP-dependent DNA helicase RecG